MDKLNTKDPHNEVKLNGKEISQTHLLKTVAHLPCANFILQNATTHHQGSLAKHEGSIHPNGRCVSEILVHILFQIRNNVRVDIAQRVERSQRYVNEETACYRKKTFGFIA